MHFTVLLIFFGEFILPVRVRIREEVRVIEMAVACHFWPEERRAFVCLILVL